MFTAYIGSAALFSGSDLGYDAFKEHFLAYNSYRGFTLTI